MIGDQVSRKALGDAVEGQRLTFVEGDFRRGKADPMPPDGRFCVVSGLPVCACFPKRLDRDLQVDCAIFWANHAGLLWSLRMLDGFVSAF